MQFPSSSSFFAVVQSLANALFFGDPCFGFAWLPFCLMGARRYFFVQLHAEEESATEFFR